MLESNKALNRFKCGLPDIRKMRKRLLQLTLLLSFPILISVQYAGDDAVEFTAYIAKDKVNIQWTATERKKIASFNIERSRDGKTFESVKEIQDEGDDPETAEFLESDFSPMPGWSYYRINYKTHKGHELVTHSVPVFYKADRMKKGELIVPEKIGSGDESGSMKAADFDGERLVFVLRNRSGEEFYLEERLTVEGNNFYLQSSDMVPEGEYMITACTKTPLLGIEVTLR